MSGTVLTAFADGGTTVSSEPSDDSEQGTVSTTRRWWLTNDILAGLLVGSLVMVVLAHSMTSLDLQTFPEPITYLYVFSVGSSVVWVFGKDAIEAWRGGK